MPGLSRRICFYRITRLLLVVAALLHLPLSAHAQGEPEGLTGPGTARGLALDRSFDFGVVDQINHFNGNLSVQIPLGITYPVNGGLSYQFVLSYNALVWDHGLIDHPTLGTLRVTFLNEHEKGNAGMGWSLSLGRLFVSDTDSPGASEVIYVGEDGGRHKFFPTLHEGDPEDAGDSVGTQKVQYTRDGTYLRYKWVSSTLRQIEFPNGTIKRFEHATGGTGQFLEYMLTQIKDAYDSVSTNSVSIQYLPSLSNWTQWKITDAHNREHFVDFFVTLSNEFPKILTKVRLEPFGGGPQAEWLLGYSTFTIPRACPNDDPGTALQDVPILTNITQPDNSVYELAYHEPLFPSATCDNKPGYLKELTLPTKGKIAWDYGAYSFPTTREGPPPDPQGTVATFGVTERVEKDRDGNELGKWTYDQSLGPLCNDSYVESKTTVTDPDVNETDHYFSVVLLGEGTGCGATAADYGLPFTPSTSLPAPDDDLHLSTQTFDSNGTLLRSRYVAYERDAVDPLAPLDEQSLSNRRVLKDRTVYVLDPQTTEFAGSESSDFDGLGHYRTQTTNGDFVAGNVRTTTTRFNRNRGRYEIDPATNLPTTHHTFTMLPSSSPWILNTFDRRSATEGTDTNVQTFCFDENTGFLKRRRILKGSSEGTTDLIAEFVSKRTETLPMVPIGNVEFERYYGGDDPTQALDTSSNLCNLDLPAQEEYELKHHYQHGSLEKSEYLDAGGGVFQELFDHAIDSSTGLVASTTTPDGITTTFDYDELGRLTQEKPQPNEGAQVDYTFVNATPTAKAQVQIQRTANPGGGVLAEEILVVDDLGRLFQEKRRLPGGTLNLRETLYNDRGLRQSVSETVADGTPATKVTEFRDYDAFGRPGTIRPADGPGHDVTFTYKGVSEVARTVMIATTGNLGLTETATTTTEIYDRQGRLHQVLEHSGTGGVPIPTTYEYDASSRLAKTSTTDGTTTQERHFTYDGRGFLTSERHPEKGALGNGLVQYQGYDSRGHFTTKSDGSVTLTYSYDRAGRLRSVIEASAGNRLLKELDYGNSASGRSYGKLTAATRHNYLLAFPGQDLQITDLYTYNGTGGRVSKKEIQRTDAGPTSTPRTTWFTQDFTWTDLGEPATLTYPSCVIPTECTGGTNPSGQPARTVTYQYKQGFLETVEDGATLLATVSYHPNEMLASVAFNGGATTHWDQDPDSMRRPARIFTTGVTGGDNFDSGTFQYDGAGNIKTQGSNSYLYDGVSRLVFGESQQGQIQESSGYDAFGNRVEATTFPVGSRSIPVDPDTNRLLSSTALAVSYDDRGNQTEWGDADYTFDALDQMILQTDSTTVPTATDVSYVYGADDERIVVIKNPNPANETWYLRDLDGRVLRKFFREVGNTDWQKDTLHRQGQILATDRLGFLEHAHLDHLGTIRLWTLSDGSSPKHLRYTAFGEEIADNSANRDHQFTGHERDRSRVAGCTGTTTVNNETLSTGQLRTACDELSSENTTITSVDEVRFVAGNRVVLGGGFNVAIGATFAAEIDGNLNSSNRDLDYMHARYCNPVNGRFLSVDPAEEREPVKQPQKWNRYSYVENNPLAYVDPDGRERAGIFLDLDSEALLRGEITREEFRANVQARGIGALVGAATVGTAAVAPAALPFLARTFPGPMAALLLRPQIPQTATTIVAEFADELSTGGGGSTLTVISQLDNAIDAGRALSTAAGEGAQALATASRTGGRFFKATLPNALVNRLVEAKLVDRTYTIMNGKVAIELRFSSAAMKELAQFFDEFDPKG